MIKNTRYTLTGSRLATLCGVSQGTVDRALHGRSEISPATRDKILSVAKRYGFINENERPDTNKRFGIIGVVVLDVANEYFSNLLMHIESCCRKSGYVISVMFSQNDPANELLCIESLYKMGADGLILCPVGGGKDEEDMEIYRRYLQSLNIPVVAVGNKIDGINYVGIDDYEAMKAVTKKVIGLGYKRLIYPSPLKPGNGIYAMAQVLRQKAFIEAAQGHGVDTDICSIEKAVELSEKRGDKCAFVCPSDFYALRLLSNARKNGAGIIGFDNVSVIDTLGLPLDSVSYDIAATAKAAMRLICEDHEKISEITIGHNIISRGSL